MSELVAMYRSGASVLTLAQEFGVHRTTVTGHLDRHGVPRRPNTRRLTNADLEQAARHYSASESLDTVGRRYGVDGTTIAREFRNIGVEIRPRRGWVVLTKARTA